MDIVGLTIEEASEKLRSKEVSSVELTEAYLSRIAEVDAGDGAISAYIEVSKDLALAEPFPNALSWAIRSMSPSPLKTKAASPSPG